MYICKCIYTLHEKTLYNGEKTTWPKFGKIFSLKRWELDFYPRMGHEIFPSLGHKIFTISLLKE